MTSSEHHSGSDRLAELAELRGWSDEAIIVNLQGDEPLTPQSILKQAARGLDEHPDTGIATLCTPITSASQLYDPHTVKVVRDHAGYALYFSRAPIPWERDALDVEAHPEHNQAFRHIGLYAYRAGYLREYAQSEPCDLERIESLEQLRALWRGIRIFVDIAEQLPGHGVDTPEDVEAVTALLLQG
jgi:3-deoxy-manno-octulosonate cytidylyltransferase (CMP-KDO synthetase)